MKSATLDTNIYIRAFQTGGPAILLLQQAKAGEFRIDVSDAIIDETCGVLRQKFKWDGYRIHDAYLKMRSIGNRVTPSETLDVMKEDQDDNRILECVAAAKSDYIVSEDKDLLRLGHYNSILIVRVAEFLELAQKRSL